MARNDRACAADHIGNAHREARKPPPHPTKQEGRWKAGRKALGRLPSPALLDLCSCDVDDITVHDSKRRARIILFQSVCLEVKVNNTR
eukprot:4017859-Karenia_brevis.AAC.1